MGASGLSRGNRSVEDLRVSGGIPKLFQGDPGQGVATVNGDGMIAALALLVAGGQVQYPSGLEEARPMTQDVGVELRDLRVLVPCAQVVTGDRPKRCLLYTSDAADE